MRLHLIASAFLAASSPAIAQEAVTEPTQDSPIDTLVDAATEPRVEQAKPAGNPLLGRLDVLIGGKTNYDAFATRLHVDF